MPEDCSSRFILNDMGWLSKKVDDAKAAASSAVKDQFQSAKEAAKEKVTGTPVAPAQSATVLTIPRTGFFGREVVGESNYTKALRNAIGKRGGEKEMWVTLEREPSNKYDKNAVRVHIQGSTVGYVPREETGELHGLLQAAERQNVVVMAWARVWFSGDKDGDPYGSVTYDLGEVAHAWPVNARPDQATSSVWPIGRRLKVSIDDEKMPVVQSALSRAFTAGKCVGYLKLDFPEGEKRMSVSYDENSIGTLSPVASSKMGEILRVASKAGRSVYVLGEFVGNAVVAEVKIMVKPPEELTVAEINALAAPVAGSEWAPPATPQ